MTLRDDVLKQGRALDGLPYRLDPPPDGVNNTDCSLFVLTAFKNAGIPFPAGVRTAEQIRQACTPIGWTDVLPGDLLFFEETYDAAGPAGPDGKIASHIGISLGAGTHRMLDANEVHGAGETNIATDYWQSHIFEARRPPQLASVTAPSPAVLTRGIDVASYQGNPDWAAVAASGIAFAFTKVTEDEGYLNPTFARNWSEMRRVGIVRGAYHFARPEGTDAVAEAQWFVSQVLGAGGLDTGDMLALDLEAGEGDQGQWVLTFLQHVERLTGTRPIVYTGTWFTSQHNIAAYPALAAYPLWLAAYQSQMPAPPAPWTEIAFWQYSDAGSVAGISGDVDLDVFNGPAAGLAKYGHGGSVTATQPEDKLSGLINAVAYLGDDLGDRIAALDVRKDSKDELAAIVAEMRRVREQYVGKRPAA